LKDFQCRWDVVYRVDGFYFSARYPGDDAFYVDEEDVADCWEAVQEVRRAVVEYLNTHNIEKNNNQMPDMKMFD
ncbi:MAG: hypothetical protein Q4B70_07410, partial [Lachnospiraceae bacterium]|nr:hypothetical protein [Lachnospiraceae bacterium]